MTLPTDLPELPVGYRWQELLARAGLHTSRVRPYGLSGLAASVFSAGRRGSLIITVGEWEDGQDWLHVSLAWDDRMPIYEDLVAVKAAVFGPRRWAYQVFAAADRHIDGSQIAGGDTAANYALHLWGRADGTRSLPDFGRFGTI